MILVKKKKHPNRWRTLFVNVPLQRIILISKQILPAN